MKFKKMCFRKFIGEMTCTLLDYNFEDSHKATWIQSRLEAKREMVEIINRWTSSQTGTCNKNAVMSDIEEEFKIEEM